MALGTTTYKVSTILGSGTPTSADVTEAEVGAIFLDQGGRVLTKSTSGDLMLIAEANAGSLSRPITSTDTTRPTSVLSGEWWKSDVGDIYFYNGTKDLPTSESGLNDNDEWVDITDKSNPKTMVYHATGSLEKNNPYSLASHTHSTYSLTSHTHSTYVAKTGDTMTGNLSFSNSSYIGDISGSIGINTNTNVLNIETNGKGIVIDNSSSNQVQLYDNCVKLVKDANGGSTVTAEFNQSNGTGDLYIIMRDDASNSVGDSLTCSSSADGQDNDQWQIGGRPILNKFIGWDMMYESNESDSKITGANFYGDTTIGIGKTQAKVLMLSENIALIAFTFILDWFSLDLPLENKLGYIKYNVESLLTSNNITTLGEGIIYFASYSFGQNDSGTYIVRTPSYVCPTTSWSGLNKEMTIYMGDADSINGSNYTCNRCKVKVFLAVEITRTGR